MIVGYLHRNGVAARTAHSGSSALQIMATDRPKIAVLDYQLPDTTGVKLATALKALVPELHMILMSAALADVERRTLEAAGIKVFVNKPVQGPKGQESAGYHGYWITDFTDVDPHLGTKADFKALVDAAHQVCPYSNATRGNIDVRLVIQ